MINPKRKRVEMSDKSYKAKKGKYDFEATKERKDLLEELSEQVHTTNRYNILFDLMASQNWSEKPQAWFEEQIELEFSRSLNDDYTIKNNSTLNSDTEIEWVKKCARSSINKIANDKSYNWLKRPEDVEDIVLDVLLRIIRAGTYDRTAMEKDKAKYIKAASASAIQEIIKEYSSHRAAVVTAHEMKLNDLEGSDIDTEFLSKSLKAMQNETYQQWLKGEEEFKKREALRSKKNREKKKASSKKKAKKAAKKTRKS